MSILDPNRVTIFRVGWSDDAELLGGDDRAEAQRIVRDFHYTRSVPSGKSHYFLFKGAIIVFSIPANPYVANVVLGRKGIVWELSRLWAADGHEKNLLTQAISKGVEAFCKIEKADALVSYADPNVGHSGGIYRAASWVFQGVCEESRVYVDGSGQRFARRKFHSGGTHLTKAQIEAKGFRQIKEKGKLRFAKGLNRWARKAVLTSSQSSSEATLRTT